MSVPNLSKQDLAFGPGTRNRWCLLKIEYRTLETPQSQLGLAPSALPRTTVVSL
jgi:hypothetical protein